MIGIFTILAALVAVSHTVELTNNARLGRTCPQHDAPWTTFLRSYRSCHTYYKCSNGKAILQWCPRGLYFNPDLLVCDYPSRTNCHLLMDDAPEVFAALPQEEVAPEELPYEDDSEELPSEDFSEVAEMASVDDLGRIGPQLGNWCPRIDGRWPTYMVDRFNCRRFYICSNGRRIHQKCPFGLYFNTRKLVCDRRENVKCRPWLPY